MENKLLPWWTWILPFLALVASNFLSLPFNTSHGVSWIYFPTNLGIVMALWWGPRVFLPVFINGTLTAYLLKLPHPEVYPIYALPETLEVFIAWILLRERFKDMQSWSPSPKNISLFFIYGLLIPSLFASPLVQIIYVFAGVAEKSLFVWQSIVTLIGDLTGALFLTLPILILATPLLYRKNLSAFPYALLPPLHLNKLSQKEWALWICTLAGTLLLGVSFKLSYIWYVYGILMLLSSAWYGLYASIFINTWVMAITISAPRLLDLPRIEDMSTIQTPATLLTLCFCSLVTGSAITSLVEKIEKLRLTESELKSAKQQAEEASAAKSEFLARMSHEIRTPLNSVLGILELLKETQLSPDQSRYLTLFSHAGENLKALINDLLDFSKIEAKAVTVENVSYNLHTTVRSVFDIMQIKAEEKGIHFELKIDKRIPPLQRGDPTRLRQVLFNLIGNALKFTNEGSVTIRLGLTKNPPQKLCIEVSDTGIGIAREKQARIFSPFFQADPGITRKYGGTGLGLVISKNLSEIMGGSLEMKSLAGRGTTFRMLLPHRPDTTNQSEKIQTPHYFWEDVESSRRCHILLVDDSEDNRVLLIHYLKNLPFDCDEAENGQQAVEKFRSHKYDLVFMDIQMPIMTGYKATELIRFYEKERRLTPTPIVALTATAVAEELQKTLASGCNSYVVKPVKKSEILEVIHQSLTTNAPVRTAPTTPPPPII